MNTLRWKALVAALLMVSSLAAASVWRPTLRLADRWEKVNLEAMFPRQIGEWVVDDRVPVQLVSPDTAAVLNKIYNQTLSRTYVGRDGTRMMLSVAYGGDQSDGTRAHRPEICYPAQGFQIMSSSVGSVALDKRSLPVQRLVAKSGARNEPITYWLTVGEEVALTGTQQKVAQLRYGMRGMIADGMLVRVSSIDNEPAKAFERQDQFVRLLVAAVAPDFRSRVSGVDH